MTKEKVGPPPIPRSTSSAGRSLRGFAIAAAAALIPVVAWASYHLWLGWKIEQRLSVVRASHIPVSVAELNGYYPAVSAVSNAASAYERAFEILEKTESSRFLEKLGELPQSPGPLPDKLRESMEKACLENTNTLLALAEATNIRLCRYPVNYTLGWATLLPHLGHLPKCSALEMSRGVLAEQKNEVQETIESIRAILQFSASLDPEPDLVSLVVQHKLDRQAAELLRWLLNHRQLSSQQLADLQEAFQAVERTNRLESALVGERCIFLAVFNSSLREILNVIDPDEHSPGALLGLYVLQFSGGLKQDEIRFLERVDECREAIILPLPAGLDRAAELRQAIYEEARPRRFILTGMLLPPFLSGVQKHYEGVARHRLVLTALALEQFRARQHRLADSPAELVPKFLPRVPQDPFNRHEVLYRKEAVGYTVYSVGPDRRDDGGTKQVPWDSKGERPDGDIIFAVGR
jgi:hypothetical protein